MGTAVTVSPFRDDVSAVAGDTELVAIEDEYFTGLSMASFDGRQTMAAGIAIALARMRLRIASRRLAAALAGGLSGRSIARERSRVAMFASALIAVSSLLRRQHRRTSQRMRPRSRFRTSRIAIWIA
jgi:hypothetical protein